MHPHSLKLAVVMSAALLASCGGGSSGNVPFTITGTAATGAAVAGKTVSMKCASGVDLSGTTSSTGTFSIEARDHKLPCMLEVDTGGAAGKLHGFAAAEGRANLTPLTALIIARALKANPSTAFGSFDAAAGSTVSGAVGAATTAIVGEASRLMGWVPAGNPLSQTFAIGDDEDKALDNLAASLSNATSTLGTLITAAAAGNTLLSALPAEEARGQDARPYAVPDAVATVTTFAPLAAADGDTVDVTNTQRIAGKMASYDGKAASPSSYYRIEVPANWNGELVMYAHGYSGEGNQLPPTTSVIRRHLIQNGYAWAASSYSKNSYDVRAGVEDTNKLALAFSTLTGKAAPTRTYLIGTSMGGHITAAALEEEALATAQNKVRYAGGMPMCGVVGDSELGNTFAAAGLAAQQISGLAAALPTSLTARQRYQMLLAPSVNPNSILAPVHAALFDNYPNPGMTPKGAAGAQYANVLANLTGGVRPLVDVGLSFGGSYAGGMVPNFGSDLTLTGILTKYNNDSSRITYVVTGDATASAALNASVPRVTPDANFNPLRRDGMRWVPQVNARPYAPVVSIHTLGDLFVPFSMQQVYRQRLNAAGATRADRVVHRAIRGASHCDFTNAEMAQAFDDLVKWVKQGTKPAGDDVLTPATVASPTYGCTFTRNVFHPVDEASNNTRTLRGVIQQAGYSCPAS